MYYRADDTVASDHFEADSIQHAIMLAEQSWASAEPGEYEVTVREYSDEEMEDPTGQVAHIVCIAE